MKRDFSYAQWAKAALVVARRHAATVDWSRTALAASLLLARKFGKGFVGSIFAFVFALGVGVLFDMTWAIEADAALMLRAIVELNPDALHFLADFGTACGLMFIGFALALGRINLVGCVRRAGDNGGNHAA